MASSIVIGTNSGFVTAVPSGDPNGTITYLENYRVATFDTSPVTEDLSITEIGWYCGNETSEANFEVGLYAADGATVPGEAGTLLEVSRTNAKGTGLGWKAVTGLNWSIDASTNYWLGIEVDNVGTPQTTIDISGTGGSGVDTVAGITLPDTFNGGTYFTTQVLALYALWVGAAAAPPYTSVNIGDEWKTASGAAGVFKVNIGDTWKNVDAMKLNVGDAWKAVTIS